ncbi:hypothetical protein, partial [Bradyrhizobium sp.]|uniref:hypothetical protein n=1 Tax=Bradyrhizobium sp. TaxID=376 RepID=UPI002E0604B0|nr:hypothetical protein [Bradyrhizobium sp.]
ANAGAAIAVDRTAAAVKSFKFIHFSIVVTPGQRLTREDVSRFHPVPLQTDVRFLFRRRNGLHQYFLRIAVPGKNLMFWLLDIYSF